MPCFVCLVFCFFNDTATTEIYTLSLHDALPIRQPAPGWTSRTTKTGTSTSRSTVSPLADRKSTRLNSSHANISYAVFCLKKKKKKHTNFHIKKKKQKSAENQ